MEGIPVDKTPKMPGSFGGVPPQIREHIQRTQEKKEELATHQAKLAQQSDVVEDAKTQASAATQVDAAPAKPSEDQLRDERWQELLKVKERNEKLLGIKITDEDIESYLFKNGYVKKTDVNVVPGKMSGTFQTMTGEIAQLVEADVAKWQQDNKNATGNAVSNQRTLIVLSYCWLEAKSTLRPGAKYRPLGGTPAERLQTIAKMGAFTVDYAHHAYNGVVALLNVALSEDDYVKKS